MLGKDVHRARAPARSLRVVIPIPSLWKPSFIGSAIINQMPSLLGAPHYAQEGFMFSVSMECKV